jgi:hypothetical protein
MCVYKKVVVLLLWLVDGTIAVNIERVVAMEIVALNLTYV